MSARCRHSRPIWWHCVVWYVRVDSVRHTQPSFYFFLSLLSELVHFSASLDVSRLCNNSRQSIINHKLSWFVFFISQVTERERGTFEHFAVGHSHQTFFLLVVVADAGVFFGELKTLFIANLVIADQKSHFDPISICCWWIVDTYSLLLLLNRWKMSLTTSSKSDMREKTFRICRDYLNGIWKMIKPQEMVLKQVRWVVNCLPFLFNLNLPFWTFL